MRLRRYHRTVVYDPRVTATGTGPPLVFVPGLEGTGLLDYRQVERLARSYRVITFRLRDSASDMHTLVNDLEAIVHAAVDRGQTDGARCATVIGESFGGALALSHALAHPEKVRRLIILNSFAYLRGQSRLRLGRRLLRTMPWSLMRIVRRLVARQMHSARTERQEIRKVLQLMQHTTRDGYLSRLSILEQYDLRPRLAELGVPTLFLAADRDRLLPSVTNAQEMASLAPHATLRILNGHGHTCLVAPDLDLAQILADWQD